VTLVIFDGDTGAPVDIPILNATTTRELVDSWLAALHMAGIFGLPHKIFLCAFGGDRWWPRRPRPRTAGSDRRCRVTNVFDAGDAFGPICQVEVGDGAEPAIYIAPIAELAFDRQHPI
jgi:hypothetical protein